MSRLTAMGVVLTTLGLLGSGGSTALISNLHETAYQALIRPKLERIYREETGDPTMTVERYHEMIRAQCASLEAQGVSF